MTNVWAKPRFPIHIFGARGNDWPEIGPGWTELTPKQFEDANVAATAQDVYLDTLEPFGELPAEVAARTATDSTGTEVESQPAPPNKNASRDEWAAYADSRGVQYPEGAKRDEIQALVEAASTPNTEA